jgi:flagellar hook-associated protein 3 FlgL
MIRPTMIPTSLVSAESLRSIGRAQQDLARAEVELSTGRHADIEGHLGARLGASLAIRREQEHLEAILASNAVLKARIDGSEAALASVSSTVERVAQALIGTSGDHADAETIATLAGDGLAAIAAALNVSIDGVHLFAGLNTDQPPMSDYQSESGAAARSAVASAFSTTFGMPLDDPGIGSIEPADMAHFLEGAFADLFGPAAWSAAWSQASEQTSRHRISPQELVQTSISANAPAIRDVFRGMTMLAGLNMSRLNPGARAEVIESAQTILSEAVGGLTALRADLGGVAARIDAAGSRIEGSQRLLTGLLSAQEDVDVAEVANRIARLTRELEAAYAITARLQRLSLLDVL